MSRVFAPILELIDSALDLHRESPLCRAICTGLGLLTGLLLLDALLGFPPGTRMAYVLPLWIATKRGGRKAGATLVLVSTITLAVIDFSIGRHSAGFPMNFGLQTTVMYGLMRIFDSLESSLKNVTTLAMRDSLTLLYNRSAIEERARKAIDRAMVLGQPLAIAMIDCDRFKELNDRFGHAFGDDVLRILGKTMRRSTSVDATIGRSGGDEFIVLLPNRDRIQALSMMDAALDRFMSHTEIVGRSAGFSFGIAVVGEDGFEYERLLAAADNDMYRRKADRSGVSGVLAS